MIILGSPILLNQHLNDSSVLPSSVQQQLLSDEPMPASATAQGTQITYELHSLGWKAFQDLCVSVASEVLGQTVQAFLPTKDGGRDGAFHGDWSPKTGSSLSGSFTVQCKFTGRKSASLSLSHLQEELTKAARLGKRRLAQNYIIMTNHKVTAVSEERIRETFLAIPGINTFHLFGYEWICLRIRESGRLRMLVPRVYGLGDLSQILDERAYSQAQEILSSLGDDLSKYVVTDAYRRSVKAILDHGFVLLLGEPASGKSTIGASLALGSLDLWGCSALKIRNATEFVDRWNPNDSRQFFWIDDIFGATQYQPSLANEWNAAFPHLNAAIKKGARVLFTSRNYVYFTARSEIKESAFPLIKESQVVIHVDKMTIAEREQILYNHIKLGDQNPYCKRKLKPFLVGVAANKHFLPEIARRLGNKIFTRSLELKEGGIKEFVERPISFLVEVLRSLDSDSRAAIALVFMNGGAMASPLDLSSAEHKALELLGGTPAGVRRALNALDGSLVRLVTSEGALSWTFRHPTVGDAYATLIAEDPELLDIYLSGAKVDRILEEVVCGERLVQGAKVVIPESRYRMLEERLRKVPADSDGLRHFIASRCAERFVRKFVTDRPEIVSTLGGATFFSAHSSSSLLAVRLYELGLLPEEHRRRLVKTARDQVVTGRNADFLSAPKARGLFLESEIDIILNDATTELLLNIEDEVELWAAEYQPQDDPEDHFEPLKGCLAVLHEELSDREEVVGAFRNAYRAIDMAVEGLRELYNEDQDSDYEYVEAADETPDSATSQRSVFDDIDE